MVRSGAGLGPGLLRVIGRTRPWPGLARGEAPGLPQHSALGPPNITNYRGARGDTGSTAEVESHRHRTPSPAAKRHRAAQFGCSAGCPGQGIAPGRHALPGQPSARAGQIGRCTAGGGGTCRPKACRPVAARSPAHQSATDLASTWRRPAPTSRSRHEDVTRHVGTRWPEEPPRTSVSAVRS